MLLLLSRFILFARIITETSKRQVQQANSDERGTLVTTCCIVSASGTFLPPIMVSPRVKLVPQMVEGAAPGTLGLANASGWMNTEAFDEVMTHFIQKTGSSVENPTLLILDNYSSHIDINIIKKARENGITMLTLPPHTSHKLQPLDVGVFRPFNLYYNEAMKNFMTSKPGTRVAIDNISTFVAYAIKHAMKPASIQNAFKACGIHPFDRNIFSDTDFKAAEVTDKPEVSCNPELSTGDLHVSPSTSQTLQAVEASLAQLNDAGATETASNQPTTSTSGTSGQNLASPKDLRPLPRASAAQPAMTKAGKPRKKGRSMIATDSPVMKELATSKSKSTSGKRKQSKSKGKGPAKRVRRTLHQAGNDDDESDEEQEEISDKDFKELLQDESDDDYDEYSQDDDLIRVVTVTGKLESSIHHSTLSRIGE